MTDRTPTSWYRTTLRDVRRDWQEIGRAGRIALIGIGASIVVTIALGFSITASARGHLLDARADLLVALSDDLVGPTATPPHPGSEAYDQFDEEVRLRLLGGETVRVKLWGPDGTILYSDSPALEGQRFPLSASARDAFEGNASSRVSDLSDPAHELERDLGALIEFYIPFGTEGASPNAVFEIEQLTDSLDAAVGRIARNVWLSIGGGILILTIFLALLFAARTRDLNRRRRQAERLLGALFRAQEEERRHIVGALHDDIGQPLYSLLYGLEGSSAKLDANDPVATELARLRDLVHNIDATLRTELQALHQGLAEDAGLEAALIDVADRAMAQDPRLQIDVRVNPAAQLPPTGRTALYRAAQEAVVNARKHAHAQTVNVNVTVDSGAAILTVEDDGLGWEGQTGLGLTTTRERLQAIGGGLKIARRSQRGTTLTAWVPLNSERPQ